MIYKNKAAQIRTLLCAVPAKTNAEIAALIPCNVEYVRRIKSEMLSHRAQQNIYTRTKIRNRDIMERLAALERVALEIRAQVRRLHGEPDDLCERRLLGLPN